MNRLTRPLRRRLGWRLLMLAYRVDPSLAPMRHPVASGLVGGSESAILLDHPGVYMVQGQTIRRGDDGYVLKSAQQRITVDSAVETERPL